EDVEHVHMGMNGMVFVRPVQDGTAVTWAGNGKQYTKFLYNDNDGNGSTGYDREFAMFCSEVWGDSHWADAHIQLPEWSDYHPDFSLFNGRVYPDTIAPNAPYSDGWTPGQPWTKPYMPVRTIVDPGGPEDGAPDVNPGFEHLQYQPLSSLIECIEGDRVAIRFSNLGFKEAAVTIDGIDMRVVGRDATLMRGRDGTDTSYLTNTINFNAGESFDVIIEAPAFSGDNGSSGQGYDTYLLYNRAFKRSDNQAGVIHGGQATEIHVYPTAAYPTILPAQTVPNTGTIA
ncbi:MAG: hypothetical protein RJA49_1151, partial [Actinomycetota bacterium]